MKMRSKSLIIMTLAISLLLLSGLSQAQQGGTLKGKVIDKNEKFPLPTVRVSITGTKKFGVTSAEGDFVITDVPAGTYKVVFELAGYLTETQKDVTIGAGQTVEINLSMGMGFAHEMTVTARREVESLQRVPQNVTVLTTTEIKDTPIINVQQALNNVPGVDVETGSAITSLGSFMMIDGYDDVYIRKMVDGVDVGEVVSNWSMINAYPQEMIQQVEVIKGGSSSVWGSNMGGIINLITRRPTNMTRPTITLRGAFSKFGKMDFGNANAIPNSGWFQNYSANIMGNYQKFYYMAGYDRTNHDGFVQFGTEKNYSLFAKLGYNFSDTTYLDFLYNLNKIGYQNHQFFDDTQEGLPPDFPYLWNLNSTADAKTNTASLKFSSFVLPTLNIEAQLKFNRMNYDGQVEYLDKVLPDFQPPPGTVTNDSFIDQKIGFTVKGSYNPTESFSLVSGVDYYRIKADFSNYISLQPIIYVDSVAPFVNAEYRIGALGLHAGARYDYDSSFGSQLSPSVGANLNFGKASLVRVNVARTFKVPDLWYTLGVSYFDQILPNPNLKPERAWAYSAGFESQELRYVYVKLSLYYHDMRDGIVRVPADLEGRFTWGNISQFVRKGYEAEFGVTPGYGLTAYFGTNYNKHENTTPGSTATPITWIPTRTYKSGLKFKSEKMDLLINLRGRWIWWNEGESLIAFFHPKDKIWSFDLRAAKGFAVTPNTHLSVFLDVFNLTDQLFWDRSDFPNPRRWAELGIEVSFK